MQNNVESIWTEDRIGTLKTLWAAGVTFAEIAAEMGAGLTRSAIGGKLYRLQLTSKEDGRRSYSRRTPEEIEATKRAKMERRNERRRSQRVTIVRIKPVNLEALRCVEVNPLGKTLLELGPDDCRYPYGDSAPYSFCGRPIGQNSYCLGHFALSLRR